MNTREDSPGTRPVSLLTETKSLLRRFSLHARKGLGQHFLVDGSVFRHIFAAAELSKDAIVLEVGPGLGIMTRELSALAGWVIGIELDEKLAAILKETLAPSGNVAIINEDMLKVDPARLLEEQTKSFQIDSSRPLRYKVVANLPYYVASAVLRHFLEASLKPELIVVMMQKEVARQIVAKPGEMSLLSVSVQLYGEPKIVTYVPARAFYPPPDVDSAVLRIKVFPRPAAGITDTESFFTLVRAGFSARRKQIVNPLAHGLDISRSEALSLLERAGIAPQRRAETLSLEEWARLWHEFTEVGRSAREPTLET